MMTTPPSPSDAYRHSYQETNLVEVSNREVPWVSVISNALMEVASSLQQEAEQSSNHKVVSSLHGHPLEGGLDKALNRKAKAQSGSQEAKQTALNQSGFTLMMKDGLL
jgi:hypothetical protein